MVTWTKYLLNHHTFQYFFKKRNSTWNFPCIMSELCYWWRRVCFCSSARKDNILKNKYTLSKDFININITNDLFIETLSPSLRREIWYIIGEEEFGYVQWQWRGLCWKINISCVKSLNEKKLFFYKVTDLLIYLCNNQVVLR